MSKKSRGSADGMTVHEFATLVGVVDNTVTAALKTNPDLYDAIKKAEPGTESEMNARAEWYLATLPSPQAEANLRKEFPSGIVSKSDNPIGVLKNLWDARARYLMALCKMALTKIDRQLNDKKDFEEEWIADLEKKYFIPATKAYFVSFLLSHPTMKGDECITEWMYIAALPEMVQETKPICRGLYDRILNVNHAIHSLSGRFDASEFWGQKVREISKRTQKSPGTVKTTKVKIKGKVVTQAKAKPKRLK